MAGNSDPPAGRKPRARLLYGCLNTGAGAVGLFTFALVDRLAMFLVVGIGFLVFGAVDLGHAIIDHRRERLPGTANMQ